jgi:predicted MFS family arabinose efflux permease
MTLWRDRDFLKLWAGQTISEAGSRITREGVPLTAALVLHATPLDMGLLAALGGLATLLVAPIAGVVADRYRLRPILIGADIGRALVIAMIPIAASQGALRLWTLYLVIATAGILSVFFDVSYQSLVPSLVARERIHEANSKLALSVATAEAAGPALSGTLIQLLTAPIAMAIDAASFLVSAVSIIFIRKAETVKAPVEHMPSFQELTSGFRFVFQHPIMRPIGLRAATTSFFWGFFSALYVLYAVDNLKFTPFILGIIVSLGGISNFIGSALIPWISRRFQPGAILIGAALVQGVAGLLMPLAPGPGIPAILCMGGAQLFGDVSLPLYSVEELTIRQMVAPEIILGRVNAAMQLLFRGLLPIGALAGGALAQYTGVRRTILVCSVGVLLSSLWLIFSPVRTLKRESLQSW